MPMDFCTDEPNKVLDEHYTCYQMCHSHTTLKSVCPYVVWCKDPLNLVDIPTKIKLVDFPGNDGVKGKPCTSKYRLCILVKLRMAH
jgi:hypothetical protein